MPSSHPSLWVVCFLSFFKNQKEQRKEIVGGGCDPKGCVCVANNKELPGKKNWRPRSAGRGPEEAVRLWRARPVREQFDAAVAARGGEGASCWSYSRACREGRSSVAGWPAQAFPANKKENRGFPALCVSGNFQEKQRVFSAPFWKLASFPESESWSGAKSEAQLRKSTKYPGGRRVSSRYTRLTGSPQNSRQFADLA